MTAQPATFNGQRAAEHRETSARFGDNTLSPFEIQDAREAAFRASELQRGVEDRLRQHSADVAEAERAYREALSKRIVELRADGMAATACGDVARGEPAIARLRYERDVKAGVYDATRQEAFRRGADRKAVDALLEWSMRRDLRTDTPPPESMTSVIGGRRAT